MKKFISILFLSLLAGGMSFGQNLIEQGKTWSVVECVGMCETHFLKFEGDTIISGTEYQKLWYSWDSTQTNWGYYQAMRETGDGKIYRWRFDSEELLYDFNLATDEVFTTNLNGCAVEMQVYSIDSITLLNGEKRKRINFYSGEESWIGGLGSTLGPENACMYQCSFDVGYYLNCFTENDTLKFKNSQFDDCWVINVGIEDETLSLNNWQVFPNPFREYACLRFPYSETNEYELTIIDLFGKQLNKITGIRSGEIIINGQDLNPGISFFRLTVNGQNMAAGKLIRQP